METANFRPVGFWIGGRMGLLRPAYLVPFQSVQGEVESAAGVDTHRREKFEDLHLHHKVVSLHSYNWKKIINKLDFLTITNKTNRKIEKYAR